VFSVVMFDRLKVDDPVGAVSVHGVNGAWGTLATGLFYAQGFSLKVIGVQVLGIASAFVWAFVLGLIIFKVMSLTIGLRVSEEEENEGLDATEHGGSAYPNFMIIGGGPNQL